MAKREKDTDIQVYSQNLMEPDGRMPMQQSENKTSQDHDWLCFVDFPGRFKLSYSEIPHEVSHYRSASGTVRTDVNFPRQKKAVIPRYNKYN